MKLHLRPPQPTESFGDRLERKLRDLGLAAPSPPSSGEKVPDVPANLADVSSHFVGELQAQLVSWMVYIHWCAAKARGAAKMTKGLLEASKKRKRPDTEIADLIEQFTEQDVWADQLEALERATLRKKEVVSREIARRGLMDPTPPNLGHNAQRGDR